VSGYDGSQEDLYHGIGRQATSRGYNFISYEGPGQPTVRREQGLGFIPNWDAVVSPVLDYLQTRDDVDTDKLILHGHSFGAILAVRAAAVLKGRVAGVSLIDGLYNLQQVLRELFPAQLIQLYDARNETAFNAYTQAIYDSGLAPTNFKWVVNQGRWAFNTKSYFDWFDQLGNYTIDGYAQKLTVPVFVGGADHDTAGLDQAPAAAKMIGSEATFHLFQSNTGAGEHCQIGAESQLGLTLYDWVAKVVG
jgi:pimeloyl-ACP methyl ester carboxylesterase